MAATLITYADGVVTPFLDGIMQELYTSGGGLITGGTITISGASTLHITQAHGALCGREFSIDDGDYSVQLSSSGTKLGRIYLHMDLSNTANPLEVLIETGSSLTPVQQDADVNETNGVYEINLATFDVDESTISNLVSVAPTIKTLAERTLQTITDCVNSTDPQDIAGAAAVSMLNSKSLKKLWENPNPSQNFAAQHIQLSSSDYDYLIFFAKMGSYMFSDIVFKGWDAQFVNISGTNVKIYRTLVRVSDTEYNVSDAWLGSAKENSYEIPIYVYGGKL